MRTTLFALTLFSVINAFAGITGPVKMDTVKCQGNDFTVFAHYNAGTAPTSATEVLANPYKIVRLSNTQLIDQLINTGVLSIYEWDKTNWYAGLGMDINNVSDHVSLTVRGNVVEFIGGGKVEYKNSLALSIDSIDKLPKVSEGSAIKQFLRMETASYGSTLELQISRIDSAVQKCVQTEMVANPYKLDGDTTSPAMIEVCKKVEQVSAPKVTPLLTEQFAVNAVCTLSNGAQ